MDKAVPGVDKVVDKIAAMGVPGLVLLVAMAATGWVGAAAVTTALAALGGPLGMLGGIAVLGVLGLISKGLTEYGFEKIFIATVDRLREEGTSKEDIKAKIEEYPISRELKLKILDHLEKLSDAPSESQAGVCMIVPLGKPLDWVELNGMPRFTQGHKYRLEPENLPKDFTGGDVLVYSHRSDVRFVYLGRMVNARLDGSVLHFERFERFERPVLICDEGVDNRAKYYEADKGFAGPFCYVPCDAVDRVITDAFRPSPE